MMMIWEDIGSNLKRSRIPNGWIMEVHNSVYNKYHDKWEEVVVGGYFVPDPDHLWIENAEEKDNG